MKAKLPKSSTYFLFMLMIAFSCSGTKNTPGTTSVEEEQPSLIPSPQMVDWGTNQYSIPQKNIICYNKEAEGSVQWVEQLLSAANIASEVTEGENCGNWNLTLNNSLERELGEEGYKLAINSSGIHLQAAAEAGLFYGIQTLRQFFPPEIEKGKLSRKVVLRYVEITDKPEYSWRGSMVDVARSFFGLEYLKNHVDRMALYKLNRLHLHLSDDQGWRIEIKSKPALTQIGSKSATEGGNSGFLTQQEYKELQEYALARNIILIPEIDMPGHIYAALRSIPEINCEDYSNLSPARAMPPEPYTGPQVGWSKFCLEKPEVVYNFVSEVIGELVGITKGPWIHIGGDEIEDPLYEEFVVKADSIVQHYGKTSIGWEEVTKGKVSNSLISQEWHGEVESVVKNLKTIESICSSFYLDHANVPGQENTNNWCKEDGVSIEDVYTYRSKNPNAIGVEAAVWTEYVLNDQMLDNRLWPRLIAVAEVAWSLEDHLDFNDFKVRLAAQSDRIKNMGIHHFKTPGVNWSENKTSPAAGSVFSGLMPENYAAGQEE
ncbi:beta-N-acetylhexosaminidase [Zunongwangia sp. H14]|uniref:beta-N-acetylhexosaminidase n=1 Tax=Zunongwangia sp. H14 TaxID=3240792 RepID=UPI0035633675